MAHRDLLDRRWDGLRLADAFRHPKTCHQTFWACNLHMLSLFIGLTRPPYHVQARPPHPARVGDVINIPVDHLLFQEESGIMIEDIPERL